MKKKTILELNRVGLDDYLSSEKLPLAVILDNVRSEMNVGSIFRTADAFGIERIILCGITGKPPGQEIHKTALGAEDSVQWQYCKTTAEAVRALQADGYTVCAIEQVHGSKSLEVFIPSASSRYAVVLGHEVKGVDQHVIDLCNECIELPQVGTKHSLNVACTAAIVMWHFFEKLNFRG